MFTFLAGGENPQFLPTLIEARVPGILMSWFRLKKNKRKARTKMRQAKTAGCKLLLDSGAHSIYNENWNLDPRQADKRAAVDQRFRKESTLTLEELTAWCDEFVEEFTAFLLKNTDCYDSFAELDIDSLVGLEKVKEWRKAMVDAGLKPMPTYHNTEAYLKAGGTRPFVKDCIELGLDYIGLAREGEKGFHDKFFAENNDLLKEHKVRVHLWGITDQMSYRRIPGFSCDSSSWLNGSKYGTTHWWELGRTKIHLHDYKVKEKVRQDDHIVRFCKDHGIDVKKFQSDDVDSVNLYHALMWGNFAKWQVENPPNPYWLSDEEQTLNTDTKREELGMDRIIKRDDYLPVSTVGQDGRLELPRLCNTCIIKDRCPKYQKDHECAFPNMMQVKNPEDFRELVMAMVSMEAGRINQAVLIERLTGGHMDPNVSKEFRIFADMMKVMKDLIEASRPKQPSIRIEATGEEAVQKGGVLSDLFLKK